MLQGGEWQNGLSDMRIYLGDAGSNLIHGCF